MNIEEIRKYCLEKKGVTEGFPFGETALVFKVSGKIFCMADLEGELSVNLKNKPEKNLELREMYAAIGPGYHMNKKHWNTVEINDSIPDPIIKQLIDQSYELVVMGLSQIKQKELK